MNANVEKDSDSNNNYDSEDDKDGSKYDYYEDGKGGIQDTTVAKRKREDTRNMRKRADVEFLWIMLVCVISQGNVRRGVNKKSSITLAYGRRYREQGKKRGDTRDAYVRRWIVIKG